MLVKDPGRALYAVFPAVVDEFNEVISPCDIKVTVDLVAADAGARAPAERPTATSAVAAAAAMVRNARFTFMFMFSFE
jgi:hypothetical protein